MGLQYSEAVLQIFRMLTVKYQPQLAILITGLLVLVAKEFLVTNLIMMALVLNIVVFYLSQIQL
jgi:hypothetical protein